MNANPPPPCPLKTPLWALKRGFAMVKLPDIVAALPHLTTVERNTLRAALSSFIDSCGALDTVYIDAIQQITHERINLTAFRASKAYKTWMENQPVLDSVFEAVKGCSNLSKVKHLALKRLLIQLIIDHIKAAKMPLTLPAICTQAGNIRAIVDRQFPGYLGSGLGGLILVSLGGD